MAEVDWVQWLSVEDSIRVRWDGRAACMRCPEESVGQFHLFNTRAVAIALCEDCASELEEKRFRAARRANLLQLVGDGGQAVPTE